MVKTKFALYKCVEIDDVTRFKKFPLILLLWKIPYKTQEKQGVLEL